ncbi:MAG: MarR family transcriptional regulator [Proteobacteria bacterium]|nr:MAG: MarR family transcriptional regulator [Pseudomonadota bacterium]
MDIKDKKIAPEAWNAPGYLASHAARVFHRLVDAELKLHGVSLALISPLMLLTRRGALLQRDIVRESSVAQPAMVALLSKLEAEGFVKRTTDPKDKRAALVALTRKGEKIADLSKTVLLEMNAKGQQGFTSQESTLLTHLLQRLIENFERVD